MAEPTNIPRPLSPPAEENTPLLTGGGESSTQQEGAGQTTPLALSDAENAEASITTARIFFFIKLTTCVSLSTSIICLVVLLAAYITCELSPSGYYGWGFEELILQLGTFVVFSTILSILNLSTLLNAHRHPSEADSLLYVTPRTSFFWLPVTLFIDLIFVIFIWGIAGSLSSQAIFWNHCGHDINFPIEDCMRWRLAFRILGGASIFTSVVVGLAHLVLFVLRCLIAFRSGLWSRPIPWNLPTRGLTVQLTIKLLGSEGDQEGGNVNEVSLRL